MPESIAPALSSTLPDAQAADPALPGRRSVDVFVSYSHNDQKWRDWLLEVLGDKVMMTTLGSVGAWSDKDIRPGDNWYNEITNALRQARVAVLLVSAKFLGSDFVQKHELPKILAERRDGKKHVLWVPIDEGLAEKLKDHELIEIQAVWSPDDPLAKQRSEVLDATREHICSEILRALDPDGTRLRELLAPKYEIQRKLSNGRTREVYSARDHVLKRTVAISTLRRIEDLDEFRRSLQSASDLDDIERFMTIHEASLDKDPPYCVCQFIDGPSLREHLTKQGRLECSFVRTVLIDLGRALHVAHSRSFFHLNIRPSNIIIGRQGRAFLLPLKRSNMHCDHLRTNWIADPDTVELAQAYEEQVYIVPEIFAQGVESGTYERCDQYLLGLVGYEMITGICPERTDMGIPPSSIQEFDGKKLKDIRECEGCRLCPDLLATTIHRMISPYPEDRFPSLQEAVDALLEIKDVHLSKAKDSFRRLMKDPALANRLLTEFYARFRQQFRSVRAREQFEKLTDWARHHKLLREAVQLMLVHAELEVDNPREPTVLNRLLATHLEMQIPIEDYDVFREMLIAMFIENDPVIQGADDLRSDLARAWAKALGPGIEYMKRNAATAQVA